jgi:hypothetical protein
MRWSFNAVVFSRLGARIQRVLGESADVAAFPESEDAKLTTLALNIKNKESRNRLPTFPPYFPDVQTRSTRSEV